MPRKTNSAPTEEYHGHGHKGGMGLLLLIIGIIGFAIAYGYVDLPFWPTAFIVAGLWKMLMMLCCKK